MGIFVTKETVLRDCPSLQNCPFGAVAEVRCTIEKLGPFYVDWQQQHPSTTKLDVRLVRPCREDTTEDELKAFRIYLFNKRRAMPIGPAGAECAKRTRFDQPGRVILRKRDAQIQKHTLKREAQIQKQTLEKLQKFVPHNISHFRFFTECLQG